MRILALETTERIGSVAALSDDKVLVQRRLPSHLRSAESLAPGLAGLLAEVAWRPADVDLVATCVGPGSFTGLRVGVATAKVFAYCAEAEVLGVDTLEVIAAGAPRGVKELSVAVDAQRGQVVARRFRYAADGHPVAVAEAELLDIDTWLANLVAGTFVSGPVLQKIADRVPRSLQMLDPDCWTPSAATLGRLAHRDHAAGRRDDPWKLVPRYSRRAAAEEQWEARQHPGKDSAGE